MDHPAPAYTNRKELYMKITEIMAYREHIAVCLDTPVTGALTGEAVLPMTNGETGRSTPAPVLYRASADGGDSLLFPRYVQGRDLLTCRFFLRLNGEAIEGICCVTGFSADACRGNTALPPMGKPLGTWVTCPGEDMDSYGFGGMMTEINTAWIMTLAPSAEDIPHVWNNKTYWFVKSMMDTYDRLMMPSVQRGLPVLLRLINRFSYRLKGSDSRLREMIGHPAYEDTGFSEQMSAFNITTEEGMDAYCACVDFLCARYTDPASPLFCVTVMDVGNEINSQAVWHNCGPMDCQAYMEEYTQQLRLAHLIGQTYNSAFRVDVSFDHHFSRAYRPDPLRYYSAKECLLRLAEISRRDGDFSWGISAHPYPEDLTKPDFYNDATALFSYGTPRITMKNIEVWQRVAEHPAVAYGGKARAVVFDEQGFHTDYDDPESENKGAYAFVLLWLKMRRCPSIEQFLINRYTDMPQNDEGGLHLGLRYEEGYADDEHLFVHPGPYKKISYAIRAMNSPAEAQWIHDAREFIGPALFDGLLDPPRVEGTLTAEE